MNKYVEAMAEAIGDIDGDGPYPEAAQVAITALIATLRADPAAVEAMAAASITASAGVGWDTVYSADAAENIRRQWRDGMQIALTALCDWMAGDA